MQAVRVKDPFNFFNHLAREFVGFMVLSKPIIKAVLILAVSLEISRHS
jgi:hypothetical protein